MISGSNEQIVCGRLVRHAHCVGGSNFHLQFTPAYRKKVFLESKVRAVCKRQIVIKAEKLGLAVFAIEFAPNHMHVFVGNCRKYDVPEIVHDLKGSSSFIVRKECSRELSKYLWGDKFWSAGYFYEAIGNVTSSAIKFYRELAEYRVLRARMNAKTPIHENFSNEPHTQRFALGSEHQRGRLFVKSDIERQQGKHWTEQELAALKHMDDPRQKTLGDFN